MLFVFSLGSLTFSLISTLFRWRERIPWKGERSGIASTTLGSRLRGNDDPVTTLGSRLRGNDDPVTALGSRLRGNDGPVTTLGPRLVTKISGDDGIAKCTVAGK